MLFYLVSHSTTIEDRAHQNFNTRTLGHFRFLDPTFSAALSQRIGFIGVLCSSTIYFLLGVIYHCTDIYCQNYFYRLNTPHIRRLKYSVSSDLQ